MKSKRFITPISSLLFLFFVFTAGTILTGCSGSDSSSDPGISGKLTVLTTNDRHSSFLDNPYTPGNPTTLGASSTGGLARLATVFDDVRSAESDTLIFDAGDFVDGTIFITGDGGSADLNMLATMGYDAACLGNHEMSMGPKGLADMILNAEKDADGKIVPLLCANIQFSGTDNADDDLEALYGSEEETGKFIYPYIVRTTASGIKVGILGLMGGNVFMPDAMPCTFTVDYDEIQDMVETLRETEKVNTVICLSHASFSVSGDTPEGELADLAKNVSGIDLICAGHSHSMDSAQVPCEVAGSDWTTTIIEANDMTDFAGRTDLFLSRGVVDPSKSVTDFIAIDDSITGKPEILTKIIDYIADIETNYLSQFAALGDGSLFAVLASSSFYYGELNGMNMVSDAMRSSSGSDVALVTPGADTAWAKPNESGEITVYEAFKAMPHNIGGDGLNGGSLYRFNLLAAELQGILEMGTCNMGQGDRDLFVVPSGVRILFNTADLAAGTGPGYILQMYLVSPDEESETLIFDRTNSDWDATGSWMSAPGTTGLPGDPYQMLSVSTSLLTLIGLKYLSDSDGPGGSIDLWPRDNVGAQVNWDQVTDLDQFIVTDSGTEVKAWYAVAAFIESFIGSVVPDRYDDDDTNNPIGPEYRRVWDVAEHGMP
ncbi:MAG: hypothetical protein CVV44_00685 [Spirochaetae bacterium HGW-Spirochaetae-1]|jgi:2',3'-cyclic-nucleotide 2'-phosphodiesterase (5'-nucleotidase family)|nr:MAG: hypothetical protein CVV44_00685 [Spirochaetae bacterium HGW-Spirochaetae-1]